MQDAKEEVRARLNIEDVIGEYVQLKRAGRNFKGLSPFSSEKTPSFIVSPDKHIWHDFSSGKGGDIFSFIMEVEGPDFRAALEQLARRAGVDLSMYDTKQAGAAAKKKRKLLEISQLAASYYQHSLLKNNHALEYVFKKRGLSKAIVQDFRVGYAPDDGQALVRFLTKKGYSAKELSEAGLTNRFGGDIFRGRMTVPLMDSVGQVIGFTGRIIADDPDAPKYLNTPATLLYDKSRHVFALSQAKESIRKSDRAVIVEGNLDVVSSHQAGITNVVATAGTALTEWHLKALARLTPHVALAFDADKAGLAATERAIPIAAATGVELTIAGLPEGAKDPDELIQQDPALWQQAIDGAQPVVDWVLKQYSAREDMAAAAGKRRFTTAALGVVRTLPDPVEQEHYLKQIADMTDTSLTAIKAKLNDAAPADTKRLKTVKPGAADDAPTFNTHQDNLLAVLMMAPATRHLLENFDISLFTGDDRQALAEFFKTNREEAGALPSALRDIETYGKIIELKAETRYVDWAESDLELEAARLLRHMEIEHKKQRKDQLLTKLRDAEAAGDDEQALTLRQELQQLIKETAHG